jgi:hypothetical protein
MTRKAQDQFFIVAILLQAGGEGYGSFIEVTTIFH